MAYLERISVFLNRWVSWLAGSALLAMVVITVVNVILRQLHLAFVGTVEIVCFLAVILNGFSLGYTQMKRGHINIDIVVSRFSPRTQTVIDMITYFICMILFGIAAWQIAVLATHLWRLGSLSETLNIIYFPFTYSLSFGFACLFLVLLVDFLKSVVKVLKK